ncbi:PIN-like domain-containing protein, partial [Micromonospora sp. MS34]|uniref:PIN-like domain-containing protein n=1 Tax=Micromonospora sp. MS34 TaxID=3385971 RepID=UPI0039A2D024
TRYAKEQGRDLLIVTRDEKDDWWWRQQADFVGPRPELTLEYHELTGRRLFLMRPADLLARASVLEVEVDQASSVDAGRVADIDIGEENTFEPWTLDALTALLERLDQEAPVQAAALRLATPERGGRVNREKVYELGGYADDRMLRGFTKPFRRLTAALQGEGEIPAGVAPIFVARYPDGVKTSYFSVPGEVPKLLEELSPESPGAHDGAPLPN